jgi:hypothetical protein
VLKGKKLYGALYGLIVTRNTKDAASIRAILHEGFDGDGLSLWLENGKDISETCIRRRLDR